MLYLKYSRDWKRNADVAVAEVCDGASPDGPRRILIVPEQNSFDAEWRLCAAGGDGISRCAEVLSFTRLATRIKLSTSALRALQRAFFPRSAEPPPQYWTRVEE